MSTIVFMPDDRNEAAGSLARALQDWAAELWTHKVSTGVQGMERKV